MNVDSDSNPYSSLLKNGMKRENDFIYPVNYGYLDGTTSADGGGIDV